MSTHFQKYLSGEAYENQKKYYKCIFPKPNGLLCNHIGTLNEITNHLAMCHLKQHRYECRICKTRFQEKVEYEGHNANKNCGGVMSIDLEEKAFCQNDEVVLWRCTNVFVQQIQGPELAEHRRKVKKLRDSKKNQGRSTPCYNEEATSAEAPRRAVPSGFPNNSSNSGGYRSRSSSVVNQPNPQRPPDAPPLHQNPFFKPWEPAKPVSPYRPPPNYSAMNQSTPGPSSQQSARSRIDNYNLSRGRRGRSRTPNAAPVEEERTGVYSLVPKKPQEIRRRSVSRVNYGHERSKSPILYSGSGDIEETSRLKAAFQTQSRSTAKVPNMWNSRNAVLLEIPSAVPKKALSLEEKRAAVRAKLAQNLEYHKKKAEEMREQRAKRTSRSRSP